MPYSYFEWLQGFFLVHSTIGSTVYVGKWDTYEEKSLPDA